MELLSRVEKHKVNKSKDPAPYLGWLIWLTLYSAILYFLLHFIRLPDALQFRQTMQIGLFFSSVLFLDLYLLAFTVASTRTFERQDGKVARAKLHIVVAWVFSVLYHFILWMLSDPQLAPIYYYAGMAFTLAVFLLTLVHFFFYFSFVSRDGKALAQSRNLENRREAYEELKRIFCLYQLIHEVMGTDPEVRQMMKWNCFDRKLERMVLEVEFYMQASAFSREDLEKIKGVKAWLDNLLMIIEQHPTHQNLHKKLNV